MKILVACEESQAVCIELRKLGHEAYSCDLMECSGGHPEWHICMDVLKLLNGNACFCTQDSVEHIIDGRWDAIIAFPPCTHLAVSGARHFEQKRKDGRQQQGVDFFMEFTRADCDRVAIENPIGIMSKIYRKPDQIIQPWMFGDQAQKSTCLWLKGLYKLVATDIVGKGDFYISPGGKKMPSWYGDPVDENGKKMAYNSEEIKKMRSKTFPGIAREMAAQWFGPVNDEVL